ncbi:MAG: YegP family protein [Pseudomonadales bacterium]
MAGKFELYKDKAGEFRFRLKASNGQNILASEGYSARKSALGGVESVKKNAAVPARFETKSSSNGKWYFVLKAANGQDIGRSELYDSEASCASGIQSVASHAPEAALVDLTT